MITFCIGTKQSHDARYTDCTRNEAATTSQWTPAPNWGSFCASSSGWSKNKSLRWRRTDEVDWTLQIKHWAAFSLDRQHNSHRITSRNCFPFRMLHGDLETQKVLVEGRNDCIKYDSALSHLESVGRCWVRWLESKLCAFCPYNCSMAIQAPAVMVAN